MRKAIVLIAGLIIVISAAMAIGYSGKLIPTSGAELPSGWNSNVASDICIGTASGSPVDSPGKGWPFATNRFHSDIPASCPGEEQNKIAAVLNWVDYIATATLVALCISAGVRKVRAHGKV